MKEIIKKTKKSDGFVILFAVTLASIILAVTLGVINVALKEIKFGTSIKDTNDSFFAADIGVECAQYYDKSSINAFPVSGPATSISCATTTPTFSSGSNTGSYDFIITGLGSFAQGCARVNVFKDNNLPPARTTITSKGYNTGDASCNSTGSNSVEREIKVTYGGGSSASDVVFNNNSFESPLLGSGFQYSPPSADWTFSGAGVQGNGSAWGAAPAPDGTQTAFIQTTGSISQTATMNAGAYTLSFYTARRACCGGSNTQPLRVSIDGTQIGGLITPSSSISFDHVTIPITISSTGSHTLTIAGTDGSADMSSFVDLVTMTAN